MSDTSTEAVEQLAAYHSMSVDRYDAEEESGLKACAAMTAATLRSLAAERDALRAEVAALRQAVEEVAVLVKIANFSWNRYPKFHAIRARARAGGAGNE